MRTGYLAELKAVFAVVAASHLWSNPEKVQEVEALYKETLRYLRMAPPDTVQARALEVLREAAQASLDQATKAMSEVKTLRARPWSSSMAVPRPRGTTNRNDRGNSEDRRRRRAYLLSAFGDGVTCPCARCGASLTEETITVDRIIPGALDGRYTRDNIRAMCATCNSETGAHLGNDRKRAIKRV